ncbi:hypothetical protein JNM05_07575 [bacterium]|nr:hypothetical protein [bacterium]
MKTYDIKTYIVLIISAAAVTLNGCMMMAMGGMTHDSHSDRGIHQSQSVEIQKGDLKAILTVPALVMGKESEIVMKVYDRHGMAVSGAKVTMQFDADHEMKKDHNHGSFGGEERTAVETAEKGTYSLKHSFDHHGAMRVTAKISYQENSEPLVLAMTTGVSHMQENHSGRSMTPMIIAGAALMAVLMIFMIGRYN